MISMHFMRKKFCHRFSLKDHHNSFHVKLRYKCPIEGCGVIFTRRRSLYRHQNTKHTFTNRTSLPLLPIVPYRNLKREYINLNPPYVSVQPKPEPNDDTLTPPCFNVHPKSEPNTLITPGFNVQPKSEPKIEPNDDTLTLPYIDVQPKPEPSDDILTGEEVIDLTVS